jgi:hypothetical protein
MKYALGALSAMAFTALFWGACVIYCTTQSEH